MKGRRTLLAEVLGPLLLLIILHNALGRDYYGKFIGNLTTYAHKVSGQVYAVDEDTLFIKDFTYDGLGPDAFFWIGKEGDPSPSGVLVPYPEDYTDREPPILSNFDHEDIIVHLPSGYKVNEIAWFSVWCRRFTVNFGDVRIRRNLKVPRRKVLPEFKRLAHGLKSGNITILDSRTFYIPNLYYDGAGPDAYFWVGTGPEPHPGGRKIPNEKGSLSVLSGYEGEDIEIQLPEDLTVYDIDWLSVWCVAYKHNFGHVIIPKNDLDVPPSLSQFKRKRKWKRPTQTPPYVISGPHEKPKHHWHHSTPNTRSKYSNCKNFLGGRVQLQWEANNDDYVKFKLSGRISEKEWVGIGISARKGVTQMVGADAIVVFHTPYQREQFHAVDYFLSAKSQCDGQNGVCPDARIGGKNDVEIMDGYRKNGVTTVEFKRPIKASEAGKDLSLEDEVTIFAAFGGLHDGNGVFYHGGSQRTSPSEDIRFYARSKGNNSCTTLLEDAKEKEDDVRVKPWRINVIDNVKNFTARIGPAGGKRGYDAITGATSWGIAWYINDMLIPEIYVERGETYTFWVEGGDDPSNPAKYHPFYITDSHEGGMGQENQEAIQTPQRVFAGVSYDSSNYPFPTGVGRYCEWEHKTVDKSSSSSTFEEYMKTLELVCKDGRPGKLTWKVEQDTPDLVYYQCYTHKNLGWKIHVRDPGERITRGLHSASTQPSLSLFMILLISCVQCFYRLLA